MAVVSEQRCASEAVVSALGRELESRGFGREGRAAVYVRPVANDLDAWVGLNHGTRPTGAVVLNPVVGVRHRDVESDVARFTGDPARGFPPPTLRAPLSHWDAKLGSASFEEGGGWRAARRLRAVAAAIEGAAAGLADSASSLDGLADLLGDPRFSVGDEGGIRRAVALARLERDDEADDVAACLLSCLQGRTDPAAERTARFVERFRSRRRPRS